MSRVARSAYEGQWYPADRRELLQLLTVKFSESERRTGPLQSQREMGFVVPHAAPEYSGTVAAAAYRRLGLLYPESVILLGFCHSEPYRGIVAPEIDAYRTPLGEVAVDVERCHALCRAGPFVASHATDHSVEIQLPFIQLVAPRARIVPLYVGRLMRDEAAEAAQALAAAFGSKSVFVASTDFTHFGYAFGYMPFAVDENTPQRLRNVDRLLIDSMATLDVDAFRAARRETNSTMCGYQAVELMMELVRIRAAQQTLLDYQTSGEITGDYEHSVSYAALSYS